MVFRKNLPKGIEGEIADLSEECIAYSIYYYKHKTEGSHKKVCTIESDTTALV